MISYEVKSLFICSNGKFLDKELLSDKMDQFLGLFSTSTQQKFYEIVSIFKRFSEETQSSSCSIQRI